MYDKKSLGLNFFGFLFLGVGIIYILYAFYALYLAFTSSCGIGGFLCFWSGFPFLIVGFYKIRIGRAFLKSLFKNLKPMLIAIGFLDLLVGYYIVPWVPKMLRIAFWLVIYTIAFIYVLQLERKDVLHAKH